MLVYLFLIKYLIGLNPFGNYEFSLNVIGKGLARVNSAVKKLDFSLTTNSITPNISGTGGM